MRACLVVLEVGDVLGALLEIDRQPRQLLELVLRLLLDLVQLRVHFVVKVGPVLWARREWRAGERENKEKEEGGRVIQFKRRRVR